MRRSILVSALLAVASGANAGLLDYTFTGTVTSFADETGTYTGSIHIGDTYTFSAVLDTTTSLLNSTLWAASYKLAGPTTISIGSFIHDINGDAASRPHGTLLVDEGPFPDPYSYTFGGDESKGIFTMADGMPASLGRVSSTAYLDDSTNSAFSSLSVPTSIDVNAFDQRALLFTNSVFDHETDYTDPTTGDLISTPYYKTDSVVASFDSVTIAAVPEPPCLLGLGVPILALGLRRRIRIGSAQSTSA